ncbi:MAG: hypothetical protein CBC77_005440 [Euryarchaeota archaeon TMED117]|nr:MAG: hypothetical protein CBC77_005440 [Euryarchaeota archaeon TMED117]|tara:strand:- start:2315 stop:2944 length:630 start_codon:yes stop_codon:yes gene_type:complete
MALRKRWLILSFSLSILGFGIGYLVFKQVLIGFIGSLVGQFLAIVDYIDRRSTANKWIEEMLSELHIDIDDFEGALTLERVLEQVNMQTIEVEKNPVRTRGKDVRGFTGGVLESDLDEQQAIRPVSKHDVYADLEQDLTIAEQVKAEADKRYAEHAQQRWEEAERNDPDLIEAGVTRLGDLVTTDYFEKNQDSKAISKLTSDQSSSDEK